MVIDRVLVGERSVGYRLADDHHGVNAVAIQIVEIASFDNRNAERGEISGGDRPILRARVLLARGLNVPFSGELQPEEVHIVAPRNDVPYRDRRDARDLRHAALRFLIEVHDLRLSLAVGVDRDVDSEHVLGVERGVRALQVE